MQYIREFGLKLFLLKFLSKVFNKFFSNLKITQFINGKKHSTIKKYLKKEYELIINEYKNANLKVESSDTIWILWWQGLGNAPFIVKKCVESIKKYSNNVVIIDSNNINNYIEIEKEIIDKMNLNIISKTHFSDIIRMKLLSKYGGYWVDSTIFLTDNIFGEIMNKEFYSPKLNKKENVNNVSKGQWCGFFIGGYNSTLYKFVNELFVEYWKKHNLLIDYFLIDYCISIAYDEINVVRELISNNLENNVNIFKLNGLMNCKYNEEEFNSLKSTNSIHKLSYKDKKNNELKNTYYKVVICNE